MLYCIVNITLLSFHLFSPFDTYVTIMKGMIGSGMFALPLAFNRAGYGVGIRVIHACEVSIQCNLLSKYLG